MFQTVSNVYNTGLCSNSFISVIQNKESHKKFKYNKVINLKSYKV